MYYYKDYIYPIDTVNASAMYTSGQLEYEWMTKMFGAVEQNGAGAYFWGIMEGALIDCPVELVSGVFIGIWDIIRDPKAPMEGIKFIGKVLWPFGNSEEKEMFKTLVQESIAAWLEEYGTGDDREKGRMIGKMVGNIVISLIGSVGTIKKGLDAVKYLKSGGSLKYLIKSKILKYKNNFKAAADEIAVGISTTADIIKSIINTLVTKFDDLFELVDETVEMSNGILFKMKNGTEAFIDNGRLIAEGVKDAAREFCLTGCFTGEVFVLTNKGLVRIDEINEGDFVYATDLKTGEKDYKEVLQIHKRNTSEFVILNVEGEEIRTTPGHLFYIAEGTWQVAGELKPGDDLLDSKGEIKKVISVKHELLSEPEKIYNLSIDG